MVTSADLVAACRGGDAFLPLRVGQPNGLAVVRGETGVFVHVHVSVFSWKYCKQRLLVSTIYIFQTTFMDLTKGVGF